MRLRAAAGTLVFVVCCATPSSSPEQPHTPPELEKFSSELARAGMSVPLPPRLCDEVDDPDVECVHRARHDEMLREYARAILKERLPDANAARADALVDAYLKGDPQFATLALAIEQDFDARRAKKPAKEKPKTRPKPAERKPAAPSASTVDAGVAMVADAAPPVEEPASVVDAGVAVVDAVKLTLADRLVGTWATSTGGITNVYALCADGSLTVSYEANDPMLADIAGDIAPINGKWRAVDGEPPKVYLTIGGEENELTITSLSADAVTVEWAGGEAVKLERRSKSAICG